MTTDTQERGEVLTAERVREVVHKHAEASHEAGYVHVAIRYVNAALNELFSTEYYYKRTPVYQSIYRPGGLKAVSGTRPIQVEEDELVRWILEDFAGPRP